MGLPTPKKSAHPKRNEGKSRPFGIAMEPPEDIRTRKEEWFNWYLKEYFL